MIPCVVSDYHRYLTQNGAHHASHIAQLRNLCIWLKMPPPQCVFWVWGGGWRNSDEFTSTHKNKLCVSDQQPDPLCIHTTCFVRAPALIMIAHPNGLNGFFSSEVNDGAEPRSQFPGGSLWDLLCWKRVNSRGRGRATWKQKSSSCDKCHSHLHNWSSLCWWWP